MKRLPHAMPFASLSSLLAVALTGCGSADNEGFPPAPDQIPTGAFQTKEHTRWKLLAQELRIDAGESTGDRADLAKRLARPSEFLTSQDAKVKADYQAKLGTIAQEYSAASYKGRCAAIDAIQELSVAKTIDTKALKPVDFAGAKLYAMKYRLQAKNDGTAEAAGAVRTGLLVVPTAAANPADNSTKYPLVAYSHSGENGLSYAEIAGVFREAQGNHVIIAPSFPGEPVCKGGIDSATTRTCDETGKVAEATKAPREPYVTDVDELLGMHDCVVRAGIGVNDTLKPRVIAIGKQLDAKGQEVAGKPLQTSLTAFVKRIGGSPTDATDATPAMPVSYMAGVSRGGLTAQLALARAGGQLSVLGGIRDKIVADDSIPAASKGTAIGSSVQQVFGTSFFQPMRFSCAVSLFGPTTFLATEFRLALESYVKGYGDKTSFAQLPTGQQLLERWKGYGQGVKFKDAAGKPAADDAANAKLAAKLLMRMDVPLQTPFIEAALQNWTSTATDKRGALALIHGLYDKIVPSSQSKIAATVYFGVNAQAASLGFPGVRLAALGMAPKAEFLTKAADGTMTPKPDASRAFQHGDGAFFTGAYGESLTQCASGNEELDAACKQANQAQGTKYAKQDPIAAFGTWLGTDCAAASSAQ